MISVPSIRRLPVIVARRRPDRTVVDLDLARAGRARPEVVRGHGERRATGGLGHRPAGDRQQVAAVGVPVDVPTGLDLGVEHDRLARLLSAAARWCLHAVRRRTEVATANVPVMVRTVSTNGRDHRTSSVGPVTDTVTDPKNDAVNRFYVTTPIYYVNARAAPRPRLHHHHRRRADPLAPPARRRREVPHRHRRARAQDPTGRRRRGPVAAGVHRLDRPEVRRGVEAAEHRQRRLHPHHRTPPQGRRRRDAPALLRRRRHRTRRVPGARTACRASSTTPRTS